MKILNISNFYNYIKINKLKTNKIVNKIIKDIKNNGNKSLFKWTKIIENRIINNDNLIIKKSNFSKLNNKIKENILELWNRINKFHKIQKKQYLKSFIYKDKYFNYLGQIYKPIKNLGIYVPGGNTIYPSSLLMSGIPARIAGVKNIYIATPAKNIKNNLAIFYIAKLLKVKKIYNIGGAQAIAAFAFGTESIKKVDKIVGPGNSFVNEAKKKVFGLVGIDSIAGPTELMIIFDNNINIKILIYDMLAQLEHDFNSKVFLCSNDIFLLKKIIKFIRINKFNNYTILKKSIKNIYFIYVKNLKEAIYISNYIAPEHLEIFIKNINNKINFFKNFGTIFINSKEIFGDYSAGVNHVLPTSFSSKFSSPLGVYDFIKISNLVKSNLFNKKINVITSNFCKIENLYWHFKSINEK
ncbi:histidinol dehydrogenase [Candidatus Vidania fulgoroideorum]